MKKSSYNRPPYSVHCVIMGGGRGTRLYPLTKLRCKPAVPLGGSTGWSIFQSVTASTRGTTKYTYLANLTPSPYTGM